MPAKKVKANINDEKRQVKTKEFLEYKFTEEELKEHSQNLARVTREKISLENEKKAIGSEFKAKIDTKVAEAEKLSGYIQTGSEHRYIDCVMQMNTPKNGRKVLIRKDNNEQVWEKAMSAEEMQIKLDFDNEDHISDGSAVFSKDEDNHD